MKKKLRNQLIIGTILILIIFATIFTIFTKFQPEEHEAITVSQDVCCYRRLDEANNPFNLGNIIVSADECDPSERYLGVAQKQVPMSQCTDTEPIFFTM